ncbi:nibrin-like [Anneissia japonica]|uniref:nibrin-like n=1 Tax=Anneissia japonica TaxID=1529436 RepID=UPI0014256B28|nr:nibrin-like [Anneissia japonica]
MYHFFQVMSLTTASSIENQPVYRRPLPSGFFSVQTQNLIKLNPVDIKPEFLDLPVSLSRTCEASLVCRQSNRQSEDANDQRVVLGDVKNFKRFKKASYPGQQNMPHVIGGDDLYTHCNKMQEDVDEMFREMDEADNARNEHSQMAEYLFNNIQGKTAIKSRRR